MSKLIAEAEKELAEVEEILKLTDKQFDEWLRILDECFEILKKFEEVIA